MGQPSCRGSDDDGVVGREEGREEGKGRRHSETKTGRERNEGERLCIEGRRKCEGI